MSKAVILSIHPKWAEKIYSGEKEVEWRKTFPTEATPGMPVFIYETAPVCMVTGYVAYNGYDAVSIKRKRIVFDLFNPISDKENEYAFKLIVNYGCVNEKNLEKYQGKSDYIYAWYIRDQKKFKEPCPLSAYGLSRAPQSWQYITIKEADK